MGSTREMIEAYHVAWNERDAQERRRLLRHCWSEEAAMVTPGTGVVAGVEAVNDTIGSLHQHWPGDRAITSGVDEHHGLLRYSWQIVDDDGAQLVDGVAFGELASDGRLQRIVDFYDSIPGTE